MILIFLTLISVWIKRLFLVTSFLGEEMTLPNNLTSSTNTMKDQALYFDNLEFDLNSISNY